MKTGGKKNAQFASDKVHRIVLKLEDKELKGDLQGPAERDEPYVAMLGLPFDLKAGSQCIQESDIREVRLVAGSRDGWYIEDIITYFSKRNGDDGRLTENLSFKKWLDKDKKSRRSYVLNMG